VTADRSPRRATRSTCVTAATESRDLRLFVLDLKSAISFQLPTISAQQFGSRRPVLCDFQKSVVFHRFSEVAFWRTIWSYPSYFERFERQFPVFSSARKKLTVSVKLWSWWL
jgi:hypothetical protein